MRRRRVRFLLLAGLAAGALMAFKAEGEVRRDEIACEDAVQHLSDCCGASFTADVDCTFIHGGCGSPDKPTALTVQRSACIQTMTCAEVRELGACTSWASLCD